MAVEPLDFEALIGSWRRAFEAARRALEACRHDLPAPETAARSHRLADERAATARVLDSFARERQMKQFLVRLVATSWESKRLLGVPTDAVACVFNVDGVLVPSAAIHAEAWKATFDELIVRLIERTGVPFPTFSMVVDYPRLVHGRSRLASVHEFLASRGITMPDGSPDDAPGTETTYGIANRKNEALLEVLAHHGAHAFQGARLYLELVRDASMRCAVVSGSTNTRILCERAHLGALIDAYVDGNMRAPSICAASPSPTCSSPPAGISASTRSEPWFSRRRPRGSTPAEREASRWSLWSTASGRRRAGIVPISWSRTSASSRAPARP